MKALATAAVLVVFSVVAAACGGGGGSPTATSRTGDTVDLDPNLLTAVGLQPADLPAGWTSDVAFNPPSTQTAATGYSSAYRMNGLSITSNVVKYADVAARDKELTHTRGGFAKLIGPESAYRIDGSDAAFLYGGGTLPAQASIVLKGRYLVSVAFQTTSTSQAAAASDRAELDRLTGLVFNRLQKLLADPSAATAVVGAPTYSSPAPPNGGTIIVTATP